MNARPLFSRLFGWFLVLLVLVVVVIAASLAVGARTSLRRWDARLSSRIEVRVAEELEELVAVRPDPSPLEVERSLRGLLTPGVSVRVYDAQGRVLLAFQRGQRMFGPRVLPRSPSERRAPPADLGGFRRVTRPTTGEASIYFRAASEGFLTDEPNRILFASIVRALLIGLLSAVVLASAGAWLVSRHLAGTTRRIADAIDDIAGGARDRVIEQGRVRELNQIAESAQRLQRDLADQERIRTQWAQDVAHDLRTPVAAVVAQLEAVRDGVLSPDAARYQRMLAQIGRISSLVEQLNLLTRLESPGQSLNCKSVRIGDAAAAIVQAVEGQLPEGEGHEVAGEPWGPEQRGRDDRQGELELDLDLVVRAVSNLVDNALRYRTPGSRVLVRVAPTDVGGLRITVRNEGTLPDQAGRLFDRLTRGESERSSEGIGLGLSIARAVALRHGGAVTLEAVATSVVEATIDLFGCVSSEQQRNC